MRMPGSKSKYGPGGIIRGWRGGGGCGKNRLLFLGIKIEKEKRTTTK